jgi:hypothetical protein
LLFLLTLGGIVIIGRALLYETVGWIAACLYALSPVGVFYASSLWPRGHPAFVVWTLYFCYLAVHRSRPIWLIVAAAVYLFGTYVFLEIAPLGIVFVVALIQNRKVITWWTLPAIALVAALIWIPFIKFESTVNFTDVARFVTSNATVPGDPAWCGEPVDVRLLSTGEPVDVRTLDYRDPPRPRDLSFQRNLFAYQLPATVRSLFNISRLNEWPSAVNLIIGSGLFSFLMVGVGLSFLAIRGSPQTNEVMWIRSGCISAALVLGAILLALIVMRLVDAGIDFRKRDGPHLLVLVSCLGLLAMSVRFIDAPSLSSFLSNARSAQSRTLGILLLISLLVGHIAWSLVTPFEAARRSCWLWPLECLFIAFALRAWVQCLSLRLTRVLLVWLVLVGASISVARQPLEDWYRHGWSGEEQPIVKLLERLAAHRESNEDVSERNVSVSYDIPAPAFILAASSVDRRYNNGMAYDLYLKFKHNLQQELVCADSYSSVSRYLIQEDRHNWKESEGLLLDLHRPRKDTGEYVLLNREGRFSLFWRPR